MFHNISKVPEDTQEWLQKVHDSENFIDQKTEEFYESHLERINRGECNDEACIIFSEMLTDFERIVVIIHGMLRNRWQRSLNVGKTIT